MHRYTEFDRHFVRARAAQFRRPVATPSGQRTAAPGTTPGDAYGLLRGDFGHFTTCQNLQFHWIPLHRAADVLDLLPGVDMHGIRPSGNCISNTASDAFAGIAPDELVDPVKAEGPRFVAAVNQEFAALGADSTVQCISACELTRVATSFIDSLLPAAEQTAAENGIQPAAYSRWLSRNVQAHRLPIHRAVTLSLKRAGLPPGDVTADQMAGAAELAKRFGQGEWRVTHDQNLLLPWVPAAQLAALWVAARGGIARPDIGLPMDMIACSGSDLCTPANVRSIPIATALNERFADLDEQHDIGDIDLHISGCINSCGHHHSSHIGIMGVDKDGSEGYQFTVDGADGSTLSATAVAGRVIGPAFADDEVPDAIEFAIDTYRSERSAGEAFIATARRIGPHPFRTAADAVRRRTAVALTI